MFGDLAVAVVTNNTADSYGYKLTRRFAWKWTTVVHPNFSGGGNR